MDLHNAAIGSIVKHMLETIRKTDAMEGVATIFTKMIKGRIILHKMHRNSILHRDASNFYNLHQNAPKHCVALVHGIPGMVLRARLNGSRAVQFLRIRLFWVAGV